MGCDLHCSGAGWGLQRGPTGERPIPACVLPLHSDLPARPRGSPPPPPDFLPGPTLVPCHQIAVTTSGHLPGCRGGGMRWSGPTSWSRCLSPPCWGQAHDSQECCQNGPEMPNRSVGNSDPDPLGFTAWPGPTGSPAGGRQWGRERGGEGQCPLHSFDFLAISWFGATPILAQTWLLVGLGVLTRAPALYCDGMCAGGCVSVPH